MRLFNFFFIIISIFHRIKVSVIVFPFKKYTQYIKNTNYIEYLLNNDIYIDFKIGTPYQTIPLFLSIDDYPSYISGEELNEKYNRNSSSSYKQISFREEMFYFENFLSGYVSNETIEIINVKGEKEKIQNFAFIYVTSFPKKDVEVKSKSILGLKLSGIYTIRKENFIHQFKENKIIDSMAWTIKYLNDNEGELIIGGFPHEYDNNYNEINLRNVKAEMRIGTVFWDYIFSKVYSNDIIIGGEVRAYLDIRYGLIKGSFSYKKHIEENFLNDNNLCKKNDALNHTIEYYVCDLKSKIKKFPKLIFEHRELKFNFELTYEDLFEKRDDGYYCKVVFKKNDEEEIFIFGKPFLKKYQIIFEPDRKLIGVYTKKTINILNVTLWVIIVFLAIIIISLIILIIKRNKNKPRKIRANELDEEFIYKDISKEDDKLGIN